MSKKLSPLWIGSFVAGAVAITLGALFLFSGGFFKSSAKTFVTYFDGSVSGLSVGSDVQFRGVSVGKVSGIRLIYDQKDRSLVIPVEIDIDFDRVSYTERSDAVNGDEILRYFIDKGLRAQLQTKSLVTGQLMVGLAFFPETPVNLRNIKSAYPEIPAVPSTIDAITKTIEELPLDRIVTDLHALIVSMNNLVNSQAVENTISSIERAAASIDTLAQNLDSQASPLLADLRSTVNHLDVEIKPMAGDIRKTLGDVRRVVNRVESRFEPMVTGIDTAVSDAGKMVRNVDAELVPLLRSLNETTTALKGSLTRADTALVSVGDMFREDSPVYFEMTNALKNLSEASRAITILADFLERNPESLIFGKTERSGDR